MSSERQRLLSGIAALEGQRALLGDAVVDAALGPMRARVAALAADEAEAPPQAPRQSLRQLTILFLDIVGSTRLGQRLDPEEIGAVMDGALSRGTGIVAAHRGRVLQYAGDNLLAVFGADEAREDDAESAVRCGLALLALGRTLRAEVAAAHGDDGFDVRVGLHTGGVLLGGGVDEDGSIRGSAVNVAARMEQTAPPGALRISHETYTLVRGVFDVEAQEPLAIKGLDAPRPSYLVRGVKPRAFRVETRGIEGVATRMIGRDAELGSLQDAFRRTVAPGAALLQVTVVAEAGVGKSRLLYEFRNWAEARPERYFVFQARATPQTQGQPYGLLHDLFAWRFQIGDGDSMAAARQKLEAGVTPLFAVDEGEHEAEAHAHVLGQLIGLDYDDSRHIRGIRDDARQIRNRGFRAAAEALRRLGAQGGSPLVVHLDDLHWADDASLDFIDYLVQVDHDVPMLIVGCTRPTLFERQPARAGDAGDPSRLRIDLRPLDHGHSRDLAAELLKKLPDVPAALRELLTAGADGNPFYMEELVRMMIDEGVIDTRGDRWSLDPARLRTLKVPPTLTGVLQARLDGLPSSERLALQLASVIGLNFWDAALAYVEAHAADQLPPLARRELVNAKDAADDIREYAFRHQILHQVTYDTVLKHIRRSAHAKTARWLADHSGPRAKGLLGTAAEHFERAGDLVQAAEFYARAAEYTTGTFANEVGLDYAARALRLAPDDANPLRWRVLAVRERTLDLLGRRAEQKADVEALLALAEVLGDDRSRAEAAWRHGDIAFRTGDWATCAREARRAQELAGAADDEELVLRAIQRLSTAIAFQGDPAAGRSMAEAALERARALRWLGAQSRLANAVTICANLQGDRVANLQYATLSLSLARQAGDRRIEGLSLYNVGNAYLALGAYPEARRYLEDALRTIRLLGNRETEGVYLSTLSEIAWSQGEDAAALKYARSAVAIAIEVGARYAESNALWSLGNAELALGRYDEAATAFVGSEDVARAIGVSSMVQNAIDGQARVALARGDGAGAAHQVARLLASAGLDADASASVPADPDADPFAGASASLIRLTLHQAWSTVGDPRAAAVLAEAHRALQAAAGTIGDAALRDSFVARVPEHRRIVELWRSTERVDERATGR